MTNEHHNPTGIIIDGQVVNVASISLPSMPFVSLTGKKEGLVPISELAVGRVRTVEDVVSIGDEIDVKVIEIDSLGRVNLSKVQADRELGRISDEDMEAYNSRERPPRGDRGDRGARGGRGGDRRGGRNDRGGRPRR